MTPHSTRPLPDEYHRALADFASRYQPSGTPMPVSSAVAHLRKTVGKSELTDREIKEMVTEYAILRGMNLHMDGNSEN